MRARIPRKAIGAALAGVAALSATEVDAARSSGSLTPRETANCPECGRGTATVTGKPGGSRTWECGSCRASGIVLAGRDHAELITTARRVR